MTKRSSEDNFDSKFEIQRLKDDFEPHNLSKKICDAIKTQKDIDLSIKGIVKETLDNDVDTRRIVKNLIKEYRKEEAWIFWGKIIAGIISLLLSFIGGGYFFKN